MKNRRWLKLMTSVMALALLLTVSGNLPIGLAEDSPNPSPPANDHPTVRSRLSGAGHRYLTLRPGALPRAGR